MSFPVGNELATGVDERPLFSPTECRAIVDEVLRDDAWHPTGIYGPEGGRATVDSDERSGRSSPVPDIDGWPTTALIDAIAAANDERFRLELSVIPPDDAPSVLSYRAGSADHFRSHRDTGPFAPTRKLTFVVQLSDADSYVGGDLVFPELGRSATRDSGSLITFPSHEFHLVTPLLSGTRYVVVGWVHGSTLC